MLNAFGEVRNPRRYYLGKRLALERIGDDDRSLTWRAKQAEVAGTPLPATFPLRTQLVAVGYSTAHDLDGATTDELVDTVGLTDSQAQAVVNAAALL